nr:hypothetical protein GCM10025732_05480 [Glycomyces mayteni]
MIMSRLRPAAFPGGGPAVRPAPTLVPRNRSAENRFARFGADSRGPRGSDRALTLGAIPFLEVRPVAVPPQYPVYPYPPGPYAYPYGGRRGGRA